LTLSLSETVLWFVATPVATVLIITGLVMAGSGRQSKRYRPGRPYGASPVWFLSRAEPGTRSSEATVVTSRAQTLALANGATPAQASSGPTGGASDRW
jgi:hypothetical protein